MYGSMSHEGMGPFSSGPRPPDGSTEPRTVCVCTLPGRLLSGRTSGVHSQAARSLAGAFTSGVFVNHGVYTSLAMRAHVGEPVIRP